MKLAILTFVSLFTASPLFAHGMSSAAQKSMAEGGCLEFILNGAKHMITGYDHLLFLFGVIFFLSKFKDIVKFITAFTLGHCITLILATYLKISANYFLIDALIALTVIYKGFDNVGGFPKYLKTKSPNLIMLVFAFGLIHGFGLSTRLQQLPQLTLGDGSLLLKILSFNVGVEVGQIAALTVMLLLLAAWRKSESFKKFSTAANVGLMIAGSLLFLMQMHGYTHQAFADEFKFAKKDHTHTTAPAAPAANPAVATTKARSDSFPFTLAPGKGMEYKLLIRKGDIIEYSWETDGETLFFDFHGERKGDTTGDFTSYRKGTKKNDSGTFTPPFEGSHGWYWKNQSAAPVKITLNVKGAYTLKAQ